MEPPTPARKEPSRPGIRGLGSFDRAAIERMVVACGRFNAGEVATALELVDEALEKGDASGYYFAVLEEEGEGSAVRGYACYGPAPLTQGAYDLYWIVVDPAAQKKGYGRRLLEYVEKDVVVRGGRMLLIETSSQESYTDTVRFYQRAGYGLAARIRNFYRVGDDKLIFLKDLLPH